MYSPSASNLLVLPAGRTSVTAGADVPDVATILAPNFTPPDDEATEPKVERWGMGYRGVYPRKIALLVTQLHSSRGELSGLLAVRRDQARIFTGRFNISSVTARKTMAGYLRDRSDYDGWPAILEDYCRRVLTLETQGSPVVTLGSRPSRLAISCLVDPILQLGGPTILFGQGGSRKSTLAAAIAVSVQTGKELNTGWKVVQGNVLVLDWESTEDSWNDRIVKVSRALGVAPPPIAYRSCSSRLIDIADSVSIYVQSHNVKLVIVDSERQAEGASGEGDPGEGASRMMAVLRSIGATSLIIDHVAESTIQQEGNGRRKAYGSIIKENLARSTWELRSEEAQSDQPEMVLINHKVNEGLRHANIGIQMVYEQDALFVVPANITAPDLEAKTLSIGERVHRELGKGPCTSRELAEILEVPEASVRSYLSRNKIALKGRDNRWILTAPPLPLPR